MVAVAGPLCYRRPDPKVSTVGGLGVAGSSRLHPFFRVASYPSGGIGSRTDRESGNRPLIDVIVIAKTPNERLLSIRYLDI